MDDLPEFSYSQRHLWANADKELGVAEVGVTEELFDELEEILSIDVPMVGDELEMDSMCVHFHLHADIYHLRSPLSGRVTEINKTVLDNPNLLHLAPYEHWLFKMEYDEPDEFEMLMSAVQYARYLDSL